MGGSEGEGEGGDGLVWAWLYCSITAACDWMSDRNVSKLFSRTSIELVTLEQSDIESGARGFAAGGSWTSGGDWGDSEVTLIGGRLLL